MGWLLEQYDESEYQRSFQKQLDAREIARRITDAEEWKKLWKGNDDNLQAQ